ncbi:hypothetical protein [Micromonospora sp. NPDC047730]|uniref:hypothetical protein n=1 Tax=Micromonospora sp. NPDC047730 TaxID=3364253 RepID=UPI00371E149A
MVRGYWSDPARGPAEWREDAPDTCPAGHPAPTPAWTGCPDCGWGVRVWRCRDDDCGQAVVDPDHVCRE